MRPTNYEGLLPSVRLRKLRPMTEAETRMFMSMILAEHSTEFSERIRGSIGKAPMGLAIALSRAQFHKLDVSVPVLVFVACICDTPGKVIMWLYTLHLLRRTKQKTLTTDDFAYAFPDGLPNEEYCKQAWDLQKKHPNDMVPGRNDNWLDEPDFWMPETSAPG